MLRRNQFSGADQRGREEMLMITACIAAPLLLVALPTGLSVKMRLPGAQSLKETSDASVVAQFKTFGLPAKSFLTPWTPSQICLENSTVSFT
jgi:hypothetical protein